MMGGAFIYGHLNVFNTLVKELLGIGVKIDEEEQVAFLLCSMLDSRIT